MASILNVIKKKTVSESSMITIKIDNDFKEKIDFIVKKSGVKRSEYLAAILKNSEINRVYNELKKEELKEETEVNNVVKKENISQNSTDDSDSFEQKNNFKYGENDVK